MPSRPSFRRCGRWLCLPAALCAAAGIVALSTNPESAATGTLLLIGPHVASVALTALTGYRYPWAGVVGLAASVLMAGLSCWDRLDQQTEGFEWRFNNGLQNTLCCGVNYGLLLLEIAVIAVIGAAADSAEYDRG